MTSGDTLGEHFGMLNFDCDGSGKSISRSRVEKMENKISKNHKFQESLIIPV